VHARFDPFTLDTASRRLERDGAEVHLTPKAFDFLALVMTQAPRVIPKAELHARLWPSSFVSDATLVGVVKEVRRALADEAGALIRTAHRVGYAFAGALERTGDSQTVPRHWVVQDKQRIPLVEGENIIGRDPLSTVWVDATGVSRRHASIIVDGESVMLRDLGSKNGTLRSGERVRTPVSLRDGDRIQVASVVLVFRQPSAGVSTATEID
jgi:DNA-binding winged helix-turn-helix (wHTH) protein